MHDAVIVGAGPGGSATAHFLARRGLDVLLVDRATFPRDKTCGDGLTPRALRVLDGMGLLDAVASLGQPVRGYEIVAPNGRATRAPLRAGQAALVVPRRTLDDVLRRRALASGAAFEDRLAVTHLDADHDGVMVHAERGGRTTTLRARAAVLATGAASRVLLRSGILRRPPRAMLAARAYLAGLPAVGDRFQLRFDGVPLPGYGWVFPVADGRANVGVGYLPRRWHRGTSRQAFDRFVASPPLRRLLDGARLDGPVRGFPIRVDFLQSPTVGPRTLLVGEAAGLVNPLTGEGIDYALESGQVAAEHLLGMLAEDDLSPARLAAYSADLHARFGRLFRFCAQVRDWYCLPPLLNVLVALANRRPDLRQGLTDVVLGEREPSVRGPARMLGRLARTLVAG